jgi:hypothetical protein
MEIGSPPPAFPKPAASPAANPPAPALSAVPSLPAPAAMSEPFHQNALSLAGAAASPVSSMPPALEKQLRSLEEWAQANRRDAQNDAMRFWALKVPAILVSAGSGVFAYFKLDGIAVVAGAIASLCVLMDGLNPGGALRNVHRRAFNELRQLQDSMASDWQVGELRGEAPNLLAAEIIESAAKEKDRINAYITTAETSLALNERVNTRGRTQNRKS